MHTLCCFYYTCTSSSVALLELHLNTTLTHLRGIFLYGPKEKKDNNGLPSVLYINLLLINISNHVLHCYNYCVPVLVSLLMLFNFFYLAQGVFVAVYHL